MGVRIRLQRRGAKKRPFFAVVAADIDSPRDGKFLEKLGTYNPMVEGDGQLNLNAERIAWWLGKGATPTERMAKIIKTAGIEPTRPEAGA